VPNDTRFTVFSDVSTVNGTFDTILPSKPGEGQEWDLSELYLDGVIYVREEGYSQNQPTYTEENLFATTGKLAEDGYYYFSADNSTTTQQYIDNGVICFDEAGKASIAETYNTDVQTGAIKLSRNAELTFVVGGSVNSLKLALYRASGSDWGYVYGSYDGEDWILLASLTSDLINKQTNYVNLTTDKMYKSGYRYIKITQPNGASPTYLCGIALTYMQKHFPSEGIDNTSLDETHASCYDLNGRIVSDLQKSQVYIKDTGLFIVR